MRFRLASALVRLAMRLGRWSVVFAPGEIVVNGTITMKGPGIIQGIRTGGA